MPIDVIKTVREAQQHSDVVRGMEYARQVGAGGVRISGDQIAELERLGSTCTDWARVNVSPDFVPSRVRNVHLQGDVYLGAFDSDVAIAQGVRLPAGVYNACVVDSAIDDGALVQDVRLCARAVVGTGAVVMGVGDLIGLPNSRFGLGIAMRVGVETGGRDVALFPEITVPVASQIALAGRDSRMRKMYSEAVRSYTDGILSDIALVSPGARVFHTTYIRSSFVGDRALIDGALGVEGAVVLSSENEPTEVSSGSHVRRSVIQWGCRIGTGAIIEESAVLERSSVGRHAKVASSIIGPCCAIEKGEVSATLCGPLVAMHHESLLISAVWPEGRGNMGAGALVGSNHTGRAADQEVRPGEGSFFGLGVCVKYPSDFSRAPYSIYAAGLTLSPQRIEFPFSLVRGIAAPLAAAIADAKVDVHPDPCEIIPGWVIGRSAYTIARAERKFMHRCRARRHAIDPDPARASIVAMCVDARRRLQEISGSEIYTSGQCPGLGANVMTERSRCDAIEWYGFLALLKSLETVWRRASGECGVAGALAPAGESVDQRDESWRVHRSVLVEEHVGRSLRELLVEYRQTRSEFIDRVEASKARDDVRGNAVIEGYADAHDPAADDRHIVGLRNDLESFSGELKSFLSALDGDGPTLE